MRVGDTYKIKRMVQNGHDDKEILERFKNDYTEDEVRPFIKAARADAKSVKPSSKKKSDPLS